MVNDSQTDSNAFARGFDFESNQLTFYRPLLAETFLCYEHQEKFLENDFFIYLLPSRRRLMSHRDE